MIDTWKRCTACVKRIAKGLPLSNDDSNALGNKHTHCTWGLCSDQFDAWPDAQDHLWPVDFVMRGRHAPKYTKEHQRCPIDTRAMADKGMNGCFYTCQIFKAPKRKYPSREQVIEMYDNRIKEAEQTLKEEK